jgi:hypothetical protein
LQFGTGYKITGASRIGDELRERDTLSKTIEQTRGGHRARADVRIVVALAAGEIRADLRVIRGARCHHHLSHGGRFILRRGHQRMILRRQVLRVLEGQRGRWCLRRKKGGEREKRKDVPRP